MVSIRGEASRDSLHVQSEEADQRRAEIFDEEESENFYIFNIIDDTETPIQVFWVLVFKIFRNWHIFLIRPK